MKTGFAQTLVDVDQLGVRQLVDAGGAVIAESFGLKRALS